jgi:hypothetical protein
MRHGGTSGGDAGRARAAAALGGLALLAGAPAWVPPVLFILSGAVLTGAGGLVLWQQPALYTVTLALRAHDRFEERELFTTAETLLPGDVLDSARPISRATALCRLAQE